jgi:VCBS repeat protein
MRAPISFVVALFVLAAGVGESVADPWIRHVIDDSSEGADGVRLADANGDGLLDIATPWEEGGIVRVYLNPGPEDAREPWPAVTVGEVASPEDAVLVDLDHDGYMDVVSCCEGDERSVYVHWAPRGQQLYLNSDAWETRPLGEAHKRQRWMFCMPVQLDGENGIDLVAGGKGEGAQLGWLRSPENPREHWEWRFYPVAEVGWTMSIDVADMDRDGDPDILTSIRRNPNRGSLWLENPGAPIAWPRHLIGSSQQEVMFQRYADADGDGAKDVMLAAKGFNFILHQRVRGRQIRWRTQILTIPEVAGTGKGVAVGDIDGDKKADLVFTCEHARDKQGVMWRSFSKGATAQTISGYEGVKFDRVELIDLDGDGDLDVLTCEEAAGLGVIWYENPLESARIGGEPEEK